MKIEFPGGRIFVAAFWLFICTPLLAAPQHYRFIDLGKLGGTYSFANYLNNLGEIVGDADLPNGETRGFLFSGGKMTELGLKVKATGGKVNESHASGINDAGQVVGSTIVDTDGHRHACIFAHGAITDLGVFPDVVTESVSNTSDAFAINAAGQIVGGAVSATDITGFPQHAAFFPGQQAQDFDSTDANPSRINAINASGGKVGTRQDENTIDHAVIFVTAGDIQPLPTLDTDTASDGSGINDAGVIVGYSGIPGGVSHAFAYDGTMHDLGPLPGGSGTNAYAAAINNAGDIVGGSDVTGDGVHPFLYTSGTMYDLTALAAGQLAGFTHIVPNAINDNGWIVGGGKAANGESHAFLAIPTPATTTLIAAKGDQINNSTLSVAGPPTIDATGDAAFRVIITGSSINSKNNSAILLYSGSTITTVAQTGGNDTITGATFSKLSDPVMSGSGALAFIGTLKAGTGDATTKNNVCVYTLQSGTANLVARTSRTAPGLGGAIFGSFTNIAINDAGGVALVANVNNAANSPALFASDQTGALQLIAHRGGTFNISGTSVAVTGIGAFAPLAEVGGQSRTLDVENGNVAGLLKGKGGKTGIAFAVSGSSGFDIHTQVKTSGTIPNLPGVTINLVDEPAVNSVGTLAFRTVLTGSGINATNNSGIGVVTGSSGTIPVRTGDAAPDVSGAIFAKLSDPVLNNHDHIAFVGTLKNGNGVTGANDSGIWSDADGTMKLIARKGDDAPGFGSGRFSAFEQIVLPDVGGAVMLATLSGVPAVQNTGVWTVTPDGELNNVVRTGDVLDVRGTPKTVKKIGIFQIAPAVMGQSRSFDASTDNLVYQATFTDGTWGIYEVTFP